MYESKLEFVAVLKLVQGYKPADAKVTNSDHEKRWTKISKRLMNVAIGTIVLMGAVAALTLLHPLSSIEKAIGVALTFLAFAFFLASIFADIVGNIGTLIRFREDDHRRFIKEIEHDYKHTNELIKFSRLALEDAKKHIQIRSDRVRSRIAMAFGGSDKVAIVSLVGIGWVVYKEIASKNSFTLEAALSSALSNFSFYLTLGVSLFIGLAIGAILLALQLQRYAYQIELIDLALSLKEKARKRPWTFRS